MKRTIISGTGIEVPSASISNEELVESYNAWVEKENPKRIERGEPPLLLSNRDFIVAASGVRSRHVIARDGILDAARMAPRLAPRSDDELSVEAEFAVTSARRALENAGLEATDIDMVICSASHHQRPYPAIGIEVQKALGMDDAAAFDMGLGCSSAAAGMHVAVGLVASGMQKRVLVTSPEIISGHLNFKDRQTHFIFGDASVSIVIEALGDDETRPGRFEILDSRTWTQFSNNIRTNFGFLNRAESDDTSRVLTHDKLVTQNGNRVFKEVTIAANRFITKFLDDNGLKPEDVRRYWLHQANSRMNALIMKYVLGHDADEDRAPIVLDQLGNTAAAGAVIAFHENCDDMKPGEYGLLCAFGAGYSIGASLVRKM